MGSCGCTTFVEKKRASAQLGVLPSSLETETQGFGNHNLSMLLLLCPLPAIERLRDPVL